MANESYIPLTRGAQLTRAERILAAAGSLAPRREAAELLSHLLRVPVSDLLVQLALPMRQSDMRTYATWVMRRAAGEALPHITGHLEFMGLDIVIGQSDPLAPPGAERLVEAALQWARRRAPGELLATELGTGCGVITLALAALEPRFTHIYAVDPSPSALGAAHANGARYLLNLVITWLEGARLDVVPEPVDLIVCGQHDWADLEHAPEKLRPGGALICAVDDAGRPAMDELLVRSFHFAPVWVEAQGDGPAIVVAHLSRDREGS